MSKSLPEVPNSPAELFALNEKSGFDVENPDALVDIINELHEELEPTPLQGLRAAQDLLERLHYYHYHMVEQAEENGLTAYQKQMWVEIGRAHV
mgnify:CR=1 FL=1